MKILHDGTALIVGLEKFNLDDYPDLRVIGCPMTSIEHLPIEECKLRGIKTISLRGETEFLKTITSTAEHTIGLIIALLRNYKTALNGPYKDRAEYKGKTLYGKTLGIIGGKGRIGRQVQQIAQMSGMRTMTFDNAGTTGEETFLTDEPLIDLLKKSDIVAIHIPLSGNEGFFGKWMFELMKSTGYLVNTSRDKVIEKGALLWALENKVITGAAVDFIDDPELVEYADHHDNLILTNHLGGCTVEDMSATEEFIINKVEEYLKINV